MKLLFELFNKWTFTDSPFICKVLDTEKVTVKKVEKAAINKIAQFSVITNGALLNINSIVILGMFV